MTNFYVLALVAAATAHSFPREGGVVRAARRQEAARRAAAAAVADDDAFENVTAWSALTEQLDGWVLGKGFAVTVGNASGVQYEYETAATKTHVAFSLHDVVETASTSKWPMAMMFAGLVADGTISSLDALASEYVPWWSKDTSCRNASACDAKGNITVRHLLSFTSGFDDGETAGGGAAPGKSCMDDANPKGGYEGCAKELYHTYNLTGRPGATFGYSSLHLQLMGAVAMHASGLGVQEIFAKYYVKAYGMNETTCGKGGVNPEFAVCLQTTGADYQKFLAAQLSGSVVGQDIILESEKDYTPFLRNNPFLPYGMYSFGHWLECFDSAAGYTAACEAAAVHCDPGAFGFYPLIDRKNGYWMQVVAFETDLRYPFSGIPEYLRLAIKPLVDAVMRGDDPIQSELTFGRHTPGLESMSIGDVNYVTGCALDPLTCLL